MLENSDSKISLCMIARNEEKFIGAAIESVKDIVHEIIVVDTGSTDKTKEIVTGLGGTVLTLPWENDFSAPRNLSLEQARGDWILVLDADERIAKKDLKLLKALTYNSQQVYNLIQRHYKHNPCTSGFQPISGEYPEFEIGFAGYFLNPICRLFPKRSDIYYEGIVHETVDVAVLRNKKLKFITTTIPIHHFGQSEEQVALRDKNKFYMELGKIKAEQEDSFRAWYELGIVCQLEKQHEQAIYAFKLCIAKQPNFKLAYKALGISLFESKQYEESIEIFNQGLCLDRFDCEMHLNLAIGFFLLKRVIFAEAHFKKALDIEQNNVSALCWLGRLYIESNRPTLAIASIEKALELNPGYQEAERLLLIGKQQQGSQTYL